MDLASTLGVSRTVIREALLRLRMIGLVESKKKRGAVLTNPDLMAILEKKPDSKSTGRGNAEEFIRIQAGA